MIFQVRIVSEWFGLAFVIIIIILFQNFICGDFYGEKLIYFYLGRMRVLEESKNSLPIHFALLENEEAIGHIKLSRCLGTSNTLWYTVYHIRAFKRLTKYGLGSRRVRWRKCILCWISYCFKVQTWSRTWNNYYATVREIYFWILGTRNGKSKTGFIDIGFSKILSKDWLRTVLSNDKNETLTNVGNVYQEWLSA